VRKRNLLRARAANVTPYHMTVEDNIAPELVESSSAAPTTAPGAAAVRAFNAENTMLKKGIGADAGQVRHLLHR
jgi:xanthine dehydrogenase large subunit